MLKKSCALSLLSCLPLAAFGQIITFNEHVHGTVIDNQYQQSHGLTIDVNNPNRNSDVGVIFDSNHPHPTDSDFDTDLIGPPTHNWAGGNISTTELGNLLIIAENIRDKNNDGLLDDPDDEGRRPAGDITLEFANPIVELGFDVIDIENAEKGGYYSNFYSNGQFLGQVSFADILDSNSPYYDPTVGFGDNTANTLPIITAGSLGVQDFDKVKIHLGGSGGITNLRFDTPPPPPTITIDEPAPWLSLVFGLSFLALLRRRKL